MGSCLSRVKVLSNNNKLCKHSNINSLCNDCKSSTKNKYYNKRIRFINSPYDEL